MKSSKLYQRCPRASEDHIPYKFLSGIELFMESRSNHLLVLPVAKLIENTSKYTSRTYYIISSLDTDDSHSRSSRGN